MIQILLASHGPLAGAMKETIRFILGKKDNIHTLCAYVDNDSMDLEALVDKWVSRMEEESTWVVLTDVFGGSVNNEFMNRLSQKKFHLLAGMNLPLLAELAAYKDIPDENEIKRILSDARASIQYCSPPDRDDGEDEF